METNQPVGRESEGESILWDIRLLMKPDQIQLQKIIRKRLDHDDLT